MRIFVRNALFVVQGLWKTRGGEGGRRGTDLAGRHVVHYGSIVRRVREIICKGWGEQGAFIGLCEM
jgi:hypothetical protein